jgi:hypothetical protein
MACRRPPREVYGQKGMVAGGRVADEDRAALAFDFDHGDSVPPICELMDDGLDLEDLRATFPRSHGIDSRTTATESATTTVLITFSTSGWLLTSRIL